MFELRSENQTGTRLCSIVEASSIFNKILLPSLITELFHGAICQFELRNNKCNAMYLPVTVNVGRESEIEQHEFVEFVCRVQCAVSSKHINIPTLVAPDNLYGKFGDVQGH